MDSAWHVTLLGGCSVSEQWLGATDACPLSLFQFYLLLLPVLEALVIFLTCPPLFAASHNTSGDHTRIKPFFLPLLMSLQPLCLLGGTRGQHRSTARS